MGVDEERLMVRLEAQADKMFKVLAQADREVKARMKSIDDQFSKSNRRVTDGLTQAATSYRRAGDASGAFKAQVQNASFQVSDFAVQVASGTDASRALAQQLPQLLGGLGVFGALAGAAAAIALPFAANWLAAGDEAKGVSEKITALNAALTALRSAEADASLSAGDLVDRYGRQADSIQEVLEIRRQIAQLDAERALASASTSVGASLAGSDFGGMSAAKLAEISAGFDGAIAKMNETGATFTDTLALYDGVGAELVNDIYRYSQTLTEISDTFGVSVTEARELLALTSELNAADTTEERAAAAKELAQHIYDASNGLKDASEEGLAVYNHLLDAASAGLELASLNVGGVISGWANEAGRLASNMRAAANSYIASNNPGGASYMANQYAQYGAGRQAFNEAAKESGALYQPMGTAGAAPASGAGKGGGGGRKAANPEDFLTQRLETAQAAAAAARLEAESILLGAEAAARAKAKHELLAAAKKQNLDLDKKSTETGKTLRQSIDDQAGAIAALTVEAEQYRERAQFMQGVNDDLKNGLLDSIVAGKDFGDVLSNLAKAMARAALEATLFGTGPFSRGGGGGGGLGSLLGGLFGGKSGGGSWLSFAGGGYTGAGARSGGLDGQGGFPALLHPNETVVDHTRGGGAQAASVLVTLSPGLEASILQKAQGQSVQIAQASAAATQKAFGQTASSYNARGAT